MHLSFGDKAHILTSNPACWAGGFFLLVGSIICGFFLPISDFDSLRFYFNPTAFTTGAAAGMNATNCSEDEATIFELLYRFRVNNQPLYGCSYSSEVVIKAGEKVQVEYIVAQPAYSRIAGTHSAPYSLWIAFFACLSEATGISIIYKGIYQSRKTFAIIVEACAVTSNYEKARTTSYDNDGSTVYRMVYSYRFGELVYTHRVEANSLSEYGEQEVLIIQRSAPNKAVFAKDIPGSIRERLLTLI
jgi:hypothetical protein